jgi:hypothetical protein
MEISCKQLVKRYMTTYGHVKSCFYKLSQTVSQVFVDKLKTPIQSGFLFSTNYGLGEDI